MNFGILGIGEIIGIYVKQGIGILRNWDFEEFMEFVEL